MGERGLRIPGRAEPDKQRLCFALALWNERDPILKERLYGLTNSEANHGEDVKKAVIPCVCAGALPEPLPGSSVVNRDKCIGCGVRVITCPTDAIEMVPVSEEEWFQVPSSMAEWEEMRLQYLASQK